MLTFRLKRLYSVSPCGDVSLPFFSFSSVHRVRQNRRGLPSHSGAADSFCLLFAVLEPLFFPPPCVRYPFFCASFAVSLLILYSSLLYLRKFLSIGHFIRAVCVTLSCSSSPAFSRRSFLSVSGTAGYRHRSDFRRFHNPFYLALRSSGVRPAQFRRVVCGSMRTDGGCPFP